MKNSMLVGLLLLALIVVPTASFAASPWTEQATYGDKVRHKLDFGFKNFLAGWTELLTEPYDHYKESGIGGIGKGLGRGLYHTVAYTLGGILHLVSFPLVNVDIPLPENGVSLN